MESFVELLALGIALVCFIVGIKPLYESTLLDVRNQYEREPLKKRIDSAGNDFAFAFGLSIFSAVWPTTLSPELYAVAIALAAFAVVALLMCGIQYDRMNRSTLTN